MKQTKETKKNKRKVKKNILIDTENKQMITRKEGLEGEQIGREN